MYATPADAPSTYNWNNGSASYFQRNAGSNTSGKTGTPIITKTMLTKFAACAAES